MVNVLVSRELSAQAHDAVRMAAFVRVRGVLETRAGEQRTLVASQVEELLPAEVLAMPTGKNWA